MHESRFSILPTIFLMIVVSLATSEEINLLNSEKSLSGAFARRVGAASLVAFVCDTLVAVDWLHSLARKGLCAMSRDPQHVTLEELLYLLRTDHGPLALVLDVRCVGAEGLLRQASETGLLHQPHHWLLLDAASPSNETDEDASALGAAAIWLPTVALPLDSRVYVASRSAARSAGVTWTVRGAYKVATGSALTVEKPVILGPGDEFPPPMPRKDLQGVSLRAGLVLAEGDNGHWVFADDKWPVRTNIWSKFNFGLMRLLASRHNFSLEPVFTTSWGYMRNGSFDGLTAMLQHGEVDLDAAGMAVKAVRMPVLRYTAETGVFWPKFLFRQPRLSTVSNVYALPFSRTVWAVYICATLAFTLVLVGSQRLLAAHGDQGLREEEDKLPHWVDLPLLACAFICNGGYPHEPPGISSRIVLLSLLLLALFHVTSYSACIVSLLQAPSSGYDTLRELVDSPIRMAMQDMPYNINYGNESSDPLVQRVYRQRLAKERQPFLPLEEGVARVRGGMFAFQAGITAFRVIQDTFLEEEKCDLKAVAMFPRQAVSMAVPKNSSLRDFLTSGLRWLRETGLLSREWRRWDAPAPRCSEGPAAAATAFLSVGLVEFRPVLALLGLGAAAALALLLLETALHRLTRRQLPSPATPRARDRRFAMASREHGWMGAKTRAW